jgi:hypothetical protein
MAGLTEESPGDERDGTRCFDDVWFGGIAMEQLFAASLASTTNRYRKASDFHLFST